MSLSDQLLCKRRELKPSETRVTTPGGLVYTERRSADGSTVSTPPTKPSTSHGFVVDTKPDLVVAWVLPNLAMGSQDVAQDTDLLARHEFTHVLSLGVRVPEVEACARFKCRHVDVLDLPEIRLSEYLPPCFRFIDEGRSEGRVYVHCNAGVSRSASVILAYLMREGRTLDEALVHLKSRRGVVRPNDGFMKQLRDLEVDFGKAVQNETQA